MANPLDGWKDDELERIARGGQATPAPQPDYAIPPNPMAQRKGEVDVQNTQDIIRARNIELAIAQENARREEIKQRSDMLAKGVEMAPDGTVRPIQGQMRPQEALTPQARADAIKAYQGALSMDRTIRDLETKYKKGPGRHSGLAGILDFIPDTENRDFYSSANRVRGAVKSANNLTGGESNTAIEMGLNYGPYIPGWSDTDGMAESKFKGLRDEQQKALSTAIAQLGGVPDAQGNIVPVAPNAMNQPFAVSKPASAAGVGATQRQQPIPAEMQAEYESYFTQNTLGNLNRDAYAQMRADLDARYGFGGGEAALETYRQEADALNEAARRGGTVNLTIPGPTEEMSNLDQVRNDFVASPTGTALASAANMGGFGVPERLDPEGFAAIGEINPASALVGSVAGTLGGSAAVGKVGRMGLDSLARYAPKLRAGARARMAGPMARNIATDVGYSAAYGAGSGQGAAETAVEGGIGSTVGNLIGKGAGAALGGIRAPMARSLRERGIPLTVGQAIGEAGLPGRIARGIEQRMSGFSGVGDAVKDRYTESFTGVYKTALDDALAPIGGKGKGVGEAGVENARAQVSEAYGKALQGKSVPLDQTAVDDLVSLNERMAQVPNIGQSVQYQLSRALNHLEGGTLTGEGYQKARHVLDKAAAKLMKADALEGEEGAGLLKEAIDALDNAAIRNGGSEIVTNLKKANEAYRKVSVIDDAVYRARNGTSGEPGIPTVAQLTDASAANARKFGGQGRSRPFYDLTSEAQRVLPSKVPDSGTAGRLALPMVGGAGGYYAGGGEGAVTGAALGLGINGLATAGASRAAQERLIAALMDRPDTLRRLGTQIDKRKGLFGSASLPLFIE